VSPHWTDPEFDPDQRAFYCVHVLEIPTSRWTAYDAKFFDIEMPEGTTIRLQDRADTSPICYTPQEPKLGKRVFYWDPTIDTEVKASKSSLTM
jgi:hypothetical protein